MWKHGNDIVLLQDHKAKRDVYEAVVRALNGTEVLDSKDGVFNMRAQHFRCKDLVEREAILDTYMLQ
jgi:hypothetical protein